MTVMSFGICLRALADPFEGLLQPFDGEAVGGGLLEDGAPLGDLGRDLVGADEDAAELSW